MALAMEGKVGFYGLSLTHRLFALPLPKCGKGDFDLVANGPINGCRGYAHEHTRDRSSQEGAEQEYTPVMLEIYHS